MESGALSMIFDVLVVGETPAAMTAAALLVRKGLKVAWVVPSLSGEGREVVRPKVPDIVWDLLPQPLVREMLERLGVPYKHLEKSERRGGGIQMVSPEFRTGALDGILEIRHELKRIFGLDETDLARIFPEIQPGGEEFLKKYWGQIFKRGGAKKTQPLSLLAPGESIAPSPFSVDGLRIEPSLRRFFELGIYSQSYVCQWVFPKSLVRHFLHNLGNLNLFAQGRLVSPEEIFKEVFQMGGGEIFAAGVETLLEPRREKGISLWLNKDEVVNGTVCLMAVSPEEAPELYENLHVPHRRWHMKEELEEMTYKIANILFSIDAKGIPGGMGENLTLYTGMATEPFTPLDLAFLTLEKTEESGTYEGHYTVFYEGELGEEELEGWTSEQIRRLDRLFPFMTTFLTVETVFVSGEHTLSSGDYFYYGTRKRRLGAVGIKEGAFGKNSYYIGRRQLDYMGLEGEIITAFKAVQWVLDRLTKL